MQLEAEVGLVRISELDEGVVGVRRDPGADDRIARLLDHAQAQHRLIDYVHQELLGDARRQVAHVELPVDLRRLRHGHRLDALYDIDLSVRGLRQSDAAESVELGVVEFQLRHFAITRR